MLMFVMHKKISFVILEYKKEIFFDFFLILFACYRKCSAIRNARRSCDPYEQKTNGIDIKKRVHRTNSRNAQERDAMKKRKDFYVSKHRDFGANNSKLHKYTTAFLLYLFIFLRG